MKLAPGDIVRVCECCKFGPYSLNIWPMRLKDVSFRPAVGQLTLDDFALVVTVLEEEILVCSYKGIGWVSTPSDMAWFEKIA